MTSSYRKTVEKLAEQGDVMNNMPCQWCKTPTARSTLAQLGARCRSCFEAYCAEPQSWRPTQVTVPNVLKRPEPLSPEQIAANRRETDRKVRDYAKRKGLSLADSATHAQPAEQRARARFPEEPARFAAEDRA